MATIVKPSVYVLGSAPEIQLYPTDRDGNFFIPAQARLSIKQPDGTIITVSGAGTVEVLQSTSGYLYYEYEPNRIGWYEYEVCVEDSEGHKICATNGFEVIDRVY